ncbi:unnamed protein product, partial [Sphenostylis stenocarpa]
GQNTKCSPNPTDVLHVDVEKKNQNGIYSKEEKKMVDRVGEGDINYGLEYFS